MAKTSTSTYTITRTEAVKIQFKHVLKYATGNSDDYIRKILNYVEKGWIDSFTFYATNSKNEIMLEFTLKIDFDLFNLKVRENNMVTLNKNTTENGVSSVIMDWTNFYYQNVLEKSLKTHWSVRFTSLVYNNDQNKNEIYSDLNVRTSTNNEKRWRSGNIVTDKIIVFELPEITGNMKY